MKSFISIILLSYVFLLIYSEDSSDNYDEYNTNNETAYKAANYCLGIYNKKHKNESYILTEIKFAINETLDPNSNINLMFIAKNNSKDDYEFQAIYKTGNNSKPVCDVVNYGPSEDFTLPPQASTVTIKTIKPATSTKKPTRTTTKKPTKKPTQKSTQKSTKKPSTKTTKKPNKKPGKNTTKKPKGKGKGKGKEKKNDKKISKKRE